MKHNMKLTATIALAACALAACTTAKQADDGLTFDPLQKSQAELTMHDGSIVKYDAYEKLYYVANVEDSTYQYMNIYVPEGATEQSPIFLRTYVGGYMAAKARQPQAGDATGRALQEGYVVVIPGARGRNSVQGDVYTGRAPKGLLDLKAAVRYLRRFDKEIPGNTERIVTDGTSAGGAMSALLGATGNHPDYEGLLKAMGAAEGRDDIFAAVCFCPIIDLDHADMAYEWLYNGTDSRQQGDKDILVVSDKLAALYPEYLNSLDLKAPDGTPLNADNYLEYIKSEIIRSAQIAKDAGADIPDTIGFTFSDMAGGQAPINGGMAGGRAAQMKGGRPEGMPPMGGQPPMMRRGGGQRGEYITDLDMARYLNYVVSTEPLKTAPAFDTYGVCGQQASGENEEFGDATGSKVNFTTYSAAKTGTALTDDIQQGVRMLNPMNYINDSKAAVAPHWYIRHGARDRDTGFPVPVSLALKLQNSGKDVNFLLAWNRPHSGDYALEELFTWLNGIVK